MNDFSDKDVLINRAPAKQQQGRRCFVYSLTFISAIGGFLFGYDTGVISGAMILLKEEFALNSTWQELIVSITVGCAAIFALIGSPLNNKFGRKSVILFSSVVFMAGSVLLAMSKDKYMLLVGRAIVGVAIGLSSMTIPMYIAECSPPEIRGKLVTVNSMFITGGQVVASCIDGLFSGVKSNGWRYMLGLAAVPSGIQFIGFLFLPESPRWLIQKGKTSRASKVLRKMLGGEVAVRNEVDRLEVTFQNEERKESQLCRMFSDPGVRRALVVGSGMQMFQQLAGINTVMYYSATIVQMSGVRDDRTAIWLAAGVAFVNFVGSALGVYLVERIGRRTLSLTSMAGVTLSLLFLSLSFLLPALNSPPVTLNSTAVLNDTVGCYKYTTCESCMLTEHCGFCYKTDGNKSSVADSTCVPSDPDHFHLSLIGRCANYSSTAPGPFFAPNYCPTKYSWMAVVGMVLYLLCFAPGLGTVPWTINSEIYPQWARSTGNAISTGTNWVFNVFISLTFLHLSELLTYQGAFLLYAGFALSGLIFIYLFLPETKGKPLEEIEDLFNRSWIVQRSSKAEAYKVILNGNETSDAEENTLFER